jgi:FkbM family methyltransferase
MKKIIRKIFNFIGIEIKFNRSNPVSDNEIIKRELGFVLPDEIGSFVIKGISFVRKLKTINAKFEVIENQLFVNIENLKLRINSWEELLILNEIYISGIYNYKSKNNFVFVDIGMNVGFTSLFYANMENCIKVHSFEPIYKTREFARYNLNLNSISKKIKIYEYGLGYPERSLTVNYSEEFKGSVGINGLGKHISESFVENQIIEIKDVSENIANIINDTDNLIVLKIDCEGAEYEIIHRLKNLNLLEKIETLMIEWHVNGPFVLNDILVQSNFKVFSFEDHNQNIGMIYAVK